MMVNAVHNIDASDIKPSRSFTELSESISVASCLETGTVRP